VPPEHKNADKGKVSAAIGGSTLGAGMKCRTRANASVACSQLSWRLCCYTETSRKFVTVEDAGRRQVTYVYFIPSRFAFQQLL
jgi:hypothetical protein